MMDSNLWILFSSLFLLLLLIIVYSLTRAGFIFARRYCVFVKWGACCCYLKMDWGAYQRERDSLHRLRELRHQHRQLLMHQQLSTFSQIPGAIPDSVYMFPASSITNGVGFIIVPAVAAPRPIREQLTTIQRQRILERILVFHPYSGGTTPAEGGDIEAAANTTRSKALEDGSSQNNPVINPDQSLQQPFDESSSDHADPSFSAPSVAIPSHEEPVDYENTCTICLDAFSEGELINNSTDCQHFFHKECLLGWLDQHDVCPCCRRNMVTEQDWKRVMEEDRVRVQAQVQQAVTTTN